MAYASSAPSQRTPTIAVGGGILAGLATLALIGSILWFTGGSADDNEATSAEQPAGIGVDRVGATVAGAGLQTGDCVNFDDGGGIITSFDIVDCSSPHVAQISGQIQHPDAGGEYPGVDALANWVGTQCSTLTENFLGTTILETSLADGALTPDFNDWAAGDYNTSCYAVSYDGTSIIGSVDNNGSSFPRGDEVVVSRLAPGDCFTPADETESFSLHSNSPVLLTSCDGGFNGMFFGRDSIVAPAGTEYPGQEEVGDETSSRCGQLFESYYGVPSDGFNFRYWRPNQQSWDLNDRLILCAVLADDPLDSRFDPNEYELFFGMAPGVCFNLGPEETSDSLRLDDRVRIVPCTSPHVGQMLGSGELDTNPDTPFPVDNGSQELAGDQCEALFVSFIGISPFDSELGKFPFWYPNEDGWENGDRRFACAFVEDEPRTESLENAGF